MLDFLSSVQPTRYALKEATHHLKTAATIFTDINHEIGAELVQAEQVIIFSFPRAGVGMPWRRASVALPTKTGRWRVPNGLPRRRVGTSTSRLE